MTHRYLTPAHGGRLTSCGGERRRKTELLLFFSWSPGRWWLQSEDLRALEGAKKKNRGSSTTGRPGLAGTEWTMLIVRRGLRIPNFDRPWFFLTTYSDLLTWNFVILVADNAVDDGHCEEGRSSTTWVTFHLTYAPDKILDGQFSPSYILTVCCLVCHLISTLIFLKWLLCLKVSSRFWGLSFQKESAMLLNCISCHNNGLHTSKKGSMYHIFL